MAESDRQKVEDLLQVTVALSGRRYWGADRAAAVDALSLCREHFGKDHFTCRGLHAFIAEIDWMNGLSADDLASLKQLGQLMQRSLDRARRGEHALAAADYSAALVLLEHLELQPCESMVRLRRYQVNALLSSGKTESALESAESAFAVACKAYGDGSPLVAISLGEVGQVQVYLGQYARAARTLTRVGRIFEHSRLQDSRQYSRLLCVLSELWRLLDDYDRGISCIRYAQTQMSEWDSQDPAWAIKLLQEEATLLYDQGKLHEALVKAQEADALARSSLSESDEQYLDVMQLVGTILFNLGEIDKASPLLTKAYDASRDTEALRQYGMDQSLALSYARLISAQGEADRATNLINGIVQGMELRLGVDHPLLRNYLRRQAEILRQAGKESEAAKVEKRIKGLNNAITAMRQQVLADPLCALPFLREDNK